MAKDEGACGQSLEAQERGAEAGQGKDVANQGEEVG